jgi:thymidylate synthase (FAD)
VERISATTKPQQCIYAAMHQDYSEDFVVQTRAAWPNERRSGELCVKHLLGGGRGHYGPLEHPCISLNVGYFPHSVMQQARTHRVGVSFDVQSGRYTSLRILQAAKRERPLEEVFYLRPVGEYSDRKGVKYTYTEDLRKIDLARCYDAAGHYAYQVRAGLSEEHARDLIPYAIRQHWVVSFNVRSLMHFLDMRSKADAQLEIQWLCDLIWPHFEAWTPQIAGWYKTNRLHKARLAP